MNRTPTAIFIKGTTFTPPRWFAGLIRYMYGDAGNISHVEQLCIHEHTSRDEALVCAALPINQTDD